MLKGTPLSAEFKQKSPDLLEFKFISATYHDEILGKLLARNRSNVFLCKGWVDLYEKDTLVAHTGSIWRREKAINIDPAAQ
jgi:hypothetical protein